MKENLRYFSYLSIYYETVNVSSVKFLKDDSWPCSWPSCSPSLTITDAQYFILFFHTVRYFSAERKHVESVAEGDVSLNLANKPD